MQRPSMSVETTTKAWRFHGTGLPLAFDEVKVPRAGAGEVVVTARGACLCHSDVSALDDPAWMSSLSQPPMTLGHEVAGEISDVGPGMGHWAVGDRGGLSALTSSGEAIGYGTWDGGYERAGEIGLAGVAASITEFADKDLQLIGDCAGFGTTTAEAVETLGEFGTLVQVGLGAHRVHGEHLRHRDEATADSRFHVGYPNRTSSTSCVAEN